MAWGHAPLAVNKRTKVSKIWRTLIPENEWIGRVEADYVAIGAENVKFDGVLCCDGVRA